MMKRVIITGAGGFVGSELTKKMVENGVEVVAISLDFGESFPDSSLITKIVASVDNTSVISNIIPKADYDAFYHLAWRGINGLQKTDPIVQTDNVKVAIGCAWLAKQLNCKRFLSAGTIAERAVDSLPNLEKTSGGMMYGAAKHCAHIMLDAYCKNIGLEFVWMQFSNIYGPNNKTGNLVSYTIGEIKQGKEATFGPALQPYDFVFVDDLIEAVYRLGFFEVNRNFYFLGSGKPRILKEYLEEIGLCCGRQDLIKTGIRPDDGITYSMDMFDTKPLVKDIGEYVSSPFSEAIISTIENY